ncbi:MAG: hypothetical protein LBO80_07995 [Treponema sp.]|jgi:hypothetical protein|nr:hypothetical protein [Treponema sp.]
MRSPLRLILRLPLFLAAVLCWPGCVSLVERGGRWLEGDREKILAVYRGGNFELRHVRSRKSGAESLALFTGSFPTLRINASAPDSSGGLTLFSLDFTSPSYSGWNSFTMELAGAGTFSLRGNGGTLRIETLEILQISGGKIRHQDDRITGEEALSALRNRYERIRSLTGWMHERGQGRLFADQKAFEAYWEAALFPERLPRQKRPPDWERNARWVREGERRWNETYTRETFPGELWLVRNSGALFRDWEEAAAWIYFDYRWENLAESLTGELYFSKVR